MFSSLHFRALLLWNLQSIKWMIFWIWSGLLPFDIHWILFSVRLFLWGFREVTQVFAAIWIFLNFWNCFELLEYLLVNFVDLLLIIFLDFLGFNKSAFSSLTNLVLLHRPITSSWLVVAIHDACLANLFDFLFVIRAIWDSLEHVWVIWNVLNQMVRISVD